MGLGISKLFGYFYSEKPYGPGPGKTTGGNSDY